MSAMPCAIVPLSKSDFPHILAVWESSVRASHHFLSEADIQFYKPLVFTQYLPVLSLFGLHGASGKLAGFIGVADDKIEMLFIHPDYFGRGIGKALCYFVFQELGVSKVDVNEDNQAACQFYERIGFKHVGRSEVDPSGNSFPILHLAIHDFR